jgi:hypothetical protein
MKTIVLTGARKTTLILLILFAALAVWLPLQSKLARARLAVADAETQRARIEDRIAAAMAALHSIRTELHFQRETRVEAVAAVAKAEEDLARVDPESRWVAPPSALPDWGVESPHVWLRKETLPGLEVGALTDDGELRTDVAAVFTVTESQQRALNAALPRVLAEYRALEVASAERIDEPVPGIGEDIARVTLRINPMPEEGARLKEQFKAALQNELGEQRAELLLQFSAGWLSLQFNRFGAEPRTISVTRHPNGTYDISSRSANGSSFVGSTPKIHDDYIPAHLLPLFGDVLGQDDFPNPGGPVENRLGGAAASP